MSNRATSAILFGDVGWKRWREDGKRGAFAKLYPQKRRPSGMNGGAGATGAGQDGGTWRLVRVYVDLVR